VEAQSHYPSDVLVGYALGHFISFFVSDAFITLDSRAETRISIEPSRDSLSLGLQWGY